MEEIALNELPQGASGRVSCIVLPRREQALLGELGLLPGTLVTALHRSPAGDPTAYYFRGAVIALRSSATQRIFLER